MQNADANPLAGAPEDWSEFLDWAETQINRTPSAVPLPANPRLPQRRWTALHLEERLDQAEISCIWQPEPRGNGAMVALGPLRSNSRQNGLRVRDDFDRKLGKALLLTVSGFEVVRERVGRISIDIRVPFGAYFDLIWSTGGRIRVPLPDNQRFWPLNIATDGLVDWSGSLNSIQLRTDGIGEGDIEIRALRFLPRRDAFPEPCGVRHVTLDRDRRTTIYAHAPASVEFSNLKLPRRARLQVGLGHVVPDDSRGLPASTPVAAGEDRATQTIELEVIVQHAGGQASVMKRHLEPGDRWTDVSADIGQWGGETVSLTFKIAGDSRGSVALWANPVIYEPADDPPCLVLYLIDTLGAKHMDLYGYDRPTSPNITAFAAHGVCFTRAFCNSPVTVASVSDMLFSMPAERHGVYASSIAAPLALVSLTEVLRAAGFATALFSTNVNAGPRQNTDQGFDRFVDRVGYSWAHAVDRTVPLDEVRSWLETHADRPTFLYIHTAEPHQPYQPPKGFAGRFKLEEAGLPEHPSFHPSHASPSVAREVKLYDEEVLYADARFGMFLDLLSEFGLRSRANIIVTADHGEEFMEHGHQGHGPSLHTEVLHIPLVMAGP
ncbi:MAG: sulfatase, partial [Planctomycetes bacterium]|nr:sulfatase [Planctomycetota bacterium]